MKIKVYIATFAFIASLLWTILLIRHYLSVPQGNYKADMAQLNQLIKTGKTTTAYYDTVVTAFKRRGEVLSYSIKYSYAVNGKTYTHEKTVSKDNLPKVDEQEIYYLPGNPDISSFNPEQSYQAAEAGLKTENEDMPSSGWIILSVSIPVFAFMIYLIRRQKREEKEYQLFYSQAMAEMNN